MTSYINTYECTDKFPAGVEEDNGANGAIYIQDTAVYVFVVDLMTQTL